MRDKQHRGDTISSGVNQAYLSIIFFLVIIWFDIKCPFKTISVMWILFITHSLIG